MEKLKKYLPSIIGGVLLIVLVVLVLVSKKPIKQGGGEITAASIDDTKALDWAKEQVAQKEQAVIDNEAQQAEYAQKQADQKMAMIAEVKSAGYKGDGSVGDFEEMIKTHPSCLGEFSQKKLDYYSAGGLDSFLQMFQQYNNC
jgi:hypothetical protein